VLFVVMLAPVIHAIHVMLAPDARRGAGGSGHMDVTALISIVLALLGAAILAPVINELDARWRNSYKEGLNDER
jgi:ethanolamine transporter EutH